MNREEVLVLAGEVELVAEECCVEHAARTTGSDNTPPIAASFHLGLERVTPNGFHLHRL
jgi:hypothetical protein